ncbi:YihY/virulence factor BrkB family protein [Halalkalibacillus halophilus]|uniref:YihY/virulence factor BrkB family protein n=1 Tax=Halalkalibacillus halophilus TaxID=392827 RepID=UPI000483A117|nr:YihY/virulence factor BrkB family protein [Halalkalibacillus halophilus]
MWLIFEKQFWKDFLRQFQEDDVTGMSAMLAYFFLLSLMPFMIFLLTLVGYMPLSQDQIFDMLNSYLPPDTMGMIRDNIDSLLENQNGGLLSLGILGTVWSASVGVNGLMQAFNNAYDIDEERSFIVQRGISIALTVLMILVIAVAFVLPIFGQQIGEYIFSFAGVSEEFLAIWNSLRFVISGLIIILVMTILYILAPSKKIGLRHALPGAIVATVGWMLTSLGFSYYVSNFGNYSATYGSLGGVIVLMIWLYLSGMMILIGGEVNAILSKNKRRLLRK